MITYRSTVDKTENRVVFSPRPGTSLGAKEIQRQLLYGYWCGFCRNPILFAFLTPSKVSLKKYEESRVVNGLQEFSLVIPGEHTNEETAYHIDFTPIPGRTMGIQRVAMKNHIIREEKLGHKDGATEKGTRCCPYTSVFGIRPEMLIKDTIIMGGLAPSELDEYNLPTWEQFQMLIHADTRHFFTEAYCGGLPLVNVKSDFITEAKGIVHWRGVLLPSSKKALAKAAELAAVLAASAAADAAAALIAEGLEGEEESVASDSERCFDCDDCGNSHPVGEACEESDDSDDDLDCENCGGCHSANDGCSLCSQCGAPNASGSACTMPCI